MSINPVFAVGERCCEKVVGIVLVPSELVEGNIGAEDTLGRSTLSYRLNFKYPSFMGTVECLQAMMVIATLPAFEEDTMYELSVEQLREQARRAKEAFLAIGGKLPEKSVHGGAGLSCDQLLGAATVMWWFAGQATLMGYGQDYVSFYSGAAQAYETVAQAQGCS